MTMTGTFHLNTYKKDKLCFPNKLLTKSTLDLVT